MWLNHNKFLKKERQKLHLKGILKANSKDTRFIAIQKTNQLENTLYLDQPKVHGLHIDIDTQ